MKPNQSTSSTTAKGPIRREPDHSTTRRPAGRLRQWLRFVHKMGKTRNQNWLNF